MKINKLAEKGFSHLIVPIVIVAAVAGVGTTVLIKSHAATCHDYTYSAGSSGTCVRYIQTLANHKLLQIAVDGIYGSGTKSAIQTIQGQWGLTRDGIVGPNTWGALCSTATGGPGKGGPFTSVELAAARGAGCPGY